MSTGTGIEWTDTTWNPVVGCTPVSPGCLNCYAATFAARGLHANYVGLTVRKKATEDGKTRAVFNGTVRTLPDKLTEPLRWKKPRRVFVNSMSDLFHESVPFDFVDSVFAVMALCPQHTFQVLTKRPERMAEYLRSKASPLDRDRWTMIAEIAAHVGKIVWDPRGSDPVNYYGIAGGTRGKDFSNRRAAPAWPLPNVWLGTSVERQQEADERIPHLLRCQAAVRFLSCEPLLGSIDLPRLWPLHWSWDAKYRSPQEAIAAGANAERRPQALVSPGCHLIHWIIVGGESGTGARPCHIEWIRFLVERCKSAGVPVFVKQLGANPERERQFAADDIRDVSLELHDPKGGEPSEWPEDLRVREFPQ